MPNIIRALIRLDRSKANDEDRSIPITIATEKPLPGISRGYGVVDQKLILRGMRFGESVPFLDSHTYGTVRSVLGSVRDISRNGGVLVGRVYFADTPDGTATYQNYRDGHLNDVSIGAEGDDVVRVAPMAEKNIDGVLCRAGKRPMDVFRTAELVEVSAVIRGADKDAKASRAKENVMGFESWCESKGYVLEGATEEQISEWRAEYEAEMGKGAPPAAPAVEAGKAIDPTVTRKADGDGFAMEREALRREREEYRREVEEMRRERIEAAREKAVREVFAPYGDKHADLRRKAVDEKWDVARAQSELLTVIREANESGVKTFYASTGGEDVSREMLGDVILMRSMNTKAICTDQNDLDKRVDRARKSNIDSVLEICRIALAMEGDSSRYSKEETVARAFSTHTLSGILGDSANKVLMSGYKSVDSIIPMIARDMPVNDFKAHTGYRMQASLGYELVGEDGEIKHGKVNEESFTYRARTYAKMVKLTRKDIINDDLGAFNRIRDELGRGAALTRERVFWAVFMNPGSTTDVNGDSVDFFSTTNTNYLTGSDTSLDSDALGSAVKLFLNQTDAHGHPVNVTPKYMVVPTALSVTADELFVATNFNTGGASTKAKVPNANIHHRKYQPFPVPYLSNANYTNYSDLAWYLLADPADVAAYGVCYLNGNDAPTIEQVELDSNVLGIGFRGYYDIGAAAMDPRGAVKMLGEAAGS